jgi:hypothetical protein
MLGLGLVEGHSRREAARVFGLSRDMIAKMCRFSVPPGYQRSKSLEKPKLGPLTPVIDAILAADRSAPPKQRHTAKRIFERLRLNLPVGTFEFANSTDRFLPQGPQHGFNATCDER